MSLALAKKLTIKDGQSVLLINCPSGVKQLFKEIAYSESHQSKKFDSVIIFIEDHNSLNEQLKVNTIHSAPDGKLWIAYPKKSGSITSDLNRDTIWALVNEVGLNPNRLISLNEDWSIMSLAAKGASKKPSKFGQDPPGVDRKTKTVIPPGDLSTEFEAHPKAKEFFESLAFSHKREYVGWIHDAKKEETRTRRVNKTIELLLQSKKLK